MPYIRKDQRKWIDEDIGALQRRIGSIYPEEDVPGVLNYVFTRLLDGLTPPGYRRYALAVGILETMKLEYYRRKIALYEDQKIIHHGDVYV